MNLEIYIKNINKKYKQGNATEHTYRGELEQLFQTLDPSYILTNEPKRQSCGAPDFILIQNDIPVGFIETKDIGEKDLDGDNKNKEQFDRYKASLNNLIFTDYLNFHLYRDGKMALKIKIAEIKNAEIKPIIESFKSFKIFIKNFCTYKTQTIDDSKKLAKIMADKAKMLSIIIENALKNDESYNKNSILIDQMKAFQNILIKDITLKGFADVYAQTITYGLFAARLHDSNSTTFSRQKAFNLIPKSNPFLKKLFGHIAGFELDERIRWVVDDLVNTFLASKVENMLKFDLNNSNKEDPIIYFYEDFLREYDPDIRKTRGVWYTPQPIVNFMVRTVDGILKKEFYIRKGLADTTKIKVKIQNTDKDEEVEVHKVQILDPATGTGTFLTEIVKYIYRNFKNQKGIWSKYVETELLPRLNGFELLMVSYAIAHLKIDLLLAETGFNPSTDQRIKIYLTNSLDESYHETESFFSKWLSSEANEASHIKRTMPIMCVIGNPPYSISTTNKSIWIEKLVSDYKKNLHERKTNLDDDYIKFIRVGQYFIDKNGTGILAYISNNSFIDGVTHRQMRKSLLESFDKIYIFDLHGSTRKREVCKDGSSDKNVFDIMQGVSINIFVKTGEKNKNDLGDVFHYDIQGKREYKFNFLNNNDFDSIDWKKLNFTAPYYFFVPKDFNLINSYENGFKVTEIFKIYSAGIKTKIDHIAIDFDKEKLALRIDDIITNKLNFNDIQIKYELNNTTTWEYKPGDNLVFDKTRISIYEYRPFDFRFTYFDNRFLSRARTEVMNNFFNKTNIGLEVSRNGDYVFIGQNISDEHFVSDNSFKFPLFIYLDPMYQNTFKEKTQKTPNLNKDIIDKIAKKLNLNFLDESIKKTDSFQTIDVFDYIYSVLHSKTYREKYKDFLKIDFPRVPYPKNKDTFWKLVNFGSQMRQIHLLESPIFEQYITEYPVHGDDYVEKIKYQENKVYINDNQYFKNVPLIAWEFYIGGYQPAQKWLKDRKNQKLNFNEISHYQKIIVALVETDKLIKKINKIDIE